MADHNLIDFTELSALLHILSYLLKGHFRCAVSVGISY